MHIPAMNIARAGLRDVLRYVTEPQQLEAIPVTRDVGEPIVLLRAKSLPEYAFAVWDWYQAKCSSQMYFATGDVLTEGYSVVCACCDNTYGIDMDLPSAVYKDWWHKVYRLQFADMLLGACHDHGISTLFLNKADQWGLCYGAKQRITIVEASAAMATMRQNYAHGEVSANWKVLELERTGWGDGSYIDYED